MAGLRSSMALVLVATLTAQLLTLAAAMGNPLDCGSFDDMILNAAPVTPATRCFPADHDALLDFKSGIVSDPNGALSNWTSTTDCCKWGGVVCDGVTGRVVALKLSHAHLRGVISPSVGKLASLQVLKLHDNGFNGPLPDTIGSLTSLVQLCLTGSSFSSSIPDTFGTLSNLRILDARSSNLSGHLPASIGGMSSLQELHIFGNHLTGPIPASFGQLSKLYAADMGNNLLSGPIPDGFNDNLVSLLYLFLDNNKITAVPKNLANLKNLQWVSLNGNPIKTADNLAGLATAPKLVQLQLSRCKLAGPFPAWISAGFPRTNPHYLSDQVTPGLDLSFNALTGPIPDNLGTALPDYFQGLYLNNNKFTGAIPASISQIASLKFFNVSYNHLTGQIPGSAPFLAFGLSAYKGNSGLCGPPLPACKVH